jgi:hypothetical protein
MNINDRVLLLFGFLLTLTLLLGGLRIWKGVKQQARESWPSREGRVEKAAVVRITAEASLAEISYSYRVGDEAYGGCFQVNCSDEQRAWELVRPFQGRTVQVQFNPRNPAKSAVVELNEIETSGGHYV